MFIWLKTGTSDCCLWTQWWNLRFKKKNGSVFSKTLLCDVNYWVNSIWFLIKESEGSGHLGDVHIWYDNIEMELKKVAGGDWAVLYPSWSVGKDPPTWYPLNRRLRTPQWGQRGIGTVCSRNQKTSANWSLTMVNVFILSQIQLQKVWFCDIENKSFH